MSPRAEDIVAALHQPVSEDSQAGFDAGLEDAERSGGYSERSAEWWQGYLEGVTAYASDRLEELGQS